MLPDHATPIPLLSYFTGAGFLDIGFREAGFHSVWHNEYNRRFVESFRTGFQSLYGLDEHPAVNTESIEDLAPNRVFSEAFPDRVKPKVFGIIGGPPCPDFSVGGKNRGHQGDNGKLSRTYVDHILYLNPTFFLFENVPGLVRTRKHREFFDTLKADLRRKGYLLSQRILNALEYGVPQDRERVFLIGFRKSWVVKRLHRQVQIEDETWFPWPTPLYPKAKTQFEWLDRSPFGATPAPPLGIPRELMVHDYILDQETLPNLPNQKEAFRAKSPKFHLIDEGDDSKKSFKRLHRYRYSPTAAYGNNEVHLHPTQPRRLTVREALRIQTVPDGYAMPEDMSLSDKYKTIGNGVPVKLARHVASALMSFLRGDL